MDHAARAQEGIDNALADALPDHNRKAHHPPTPSLTKEGEKICIDCEEAIDPRRLAAHPAAIRCIDCQEDFERRPA